ncbi:MAG: HD domain-containing protein, partial [Spirochaetales bacterium]|nr:HD domain-containing protein [Spirochaetales bacterium]
MDKTIIDDALRFVKNIFKGESSGHDYFHTLRVYNTATKIAKQEKADLKIVQLSALLHDVDDIKLSPETHEGKKIAVTFLKGHGVT